MLHYNAQMAQDVAIAQGLDIIVWEEQVAVAVPVQAGTHLPQLILILFLEKTNYLLGGHGLKTPHLVNPTNTTAIKRPLVNINTELHRQAMILVAIQGEEAHAGQSITMKCHKTS